MFSVFAFGASPQVVLVLRLSPSAGSCALGPSSCRAHPQAQSQAPVAFDHLPARTRPTPPSSALPLSSNQHDQIGFWFCSYAVRKGQLLVSFQAGRLATPRPIAVCPPSSRSNTAASLVHRARSLHSDAVTPLFDFCFQFPRPIQPTSFTRVDEHPDCGAHLRSLQIAFLLERVWHRVPLASGSVRLHIL